MIGKLDESLNFHSQALLLRAERQQVLASNIANADTPGYRAQDFDFAAALRAATGEAQSGAQAADLVRTSATHLGPGGAPGGPSGSVQLQYRVPGQGSLDGNSVELDAERARFADNAIRYEAALRFLNQQIKSMLSVIQS